MAGDDRVVDWGGWPRFALVCLAGLAIAGWARWPRIPLLVLTAAVVVPVVLAQSAGRLEPSL